MSKGFLSTAVASRKYSDDCMLVSFALNVVFKRPDHLGLNRTLPLVALLNGTELGTACDPIKEDLKGKAVLVLRGGCLFSLKVNVTYDSTPSPTVV